tara:strand:+ start:50 stop:1285 length:1236 start_codon:yes stop_codon:yes gene_type:complete
MPLSLVQEEVSKDDARFKVVVAGRRWGKSYLSMHEMAKAARHPGAKVFYVAPTYKMCKQIIWDDLKAKFIACRWAKKINESDLTITLINGSKIYLRSADNPDNLRGVSMSYLIMDECAMISQKMWTEVCRPALSDQQGGAMFITTPQGKSSWVYDLWQGAHTQDNWSAFQYSTLEGGNVPEEEIESARNELDERSFKQEYEASFETYAGSIYYNFDTKVNIKHADKEFERNEILHVAMDFNVSPLVAAICRVQGNQISVVDEIQMHGSNTFEMAQELNTRYPNNRIWVYPDASGQARKTSSNTSDHHILRNSGFVLKVKNINPPVKDRIAAVNASLKATDGTVKLTIDPKCKHLIKCISGQTYKVDTQIPDKSSNLDHFNDALGYLVHWINPIGRPQLTEEQRRPQIWGHH